MTLLQKGGWISGAFVWNNSVIARFDRSKYSRPSQSRQSTFPNSATLMDARVALFLNNLHLTHSALTVPDYLVSLFQVWLKRSILVWIFKWRQLIQSVSAFLCKAKMEKSKTFYIETTLWLSKSSIAFNSSATKFWAMAAINTSFWF